jgi:hypothetical protein
MIKNISRAISNLPGWRTNKKIVVIESDDWGSFRTPIGSGFSKMKAKNFPLGSNDSIRFSTYDDLASRQDLEYLFEVLNSIKNKCGHSAVMTALSLVANPDFAKIEASGFNTYSYINLKESLDIRDKSDAWPLWEEGYKNKMFVPEFHGREHLNVASWMRDLKNNDPVTREGFKYHYWGFKNKPDSLSYQEAFDLEYFEDLESQKIILDDGLKLFEKTHKRKANYFVSPRGSLHTSHEKILEENDVRFIMSSKIQLEPLGGKKFKKQYRYLGMKNKNGQIYLTRNASFEPNSLKKSDWIDSCLSEIKTAFAFKKPATISTHRVNYVSSKDAFLVRYI